MRRFNKYDEDSGTYEFDEEMAEIMADMQLLAWKVEKEEKSSELMKSHMMVDLLDDDGEIYDYDYNPFAPTYTRDEIND
jgi:hypothetical protein